MRLICLICCCSMLLCASAVADTLYIIGHKGSFDAATQREQLAEYYLLKRKKNALGETVIPINLPGNNPLRAEFTQVIFDRPPLALSEYWDRMSFRGVKPPLVQGSEAAVVLFVSRLKGAIGYVSQKPAADSGVVILSEFTL